MPHPALKKTPSGKSLRLAMPARFDERCLRIAPDFRSGDGQGALAALVLMGVFALMALYGFVSGHTPVFGAGVGFIVLGFILLSISLSAKRRQLRRSAPLLFHHTKLEVMLSRWNEADAALEFRPFPWRAVSYEKVDTGMTLSFTRSWVIPLDPEAEREGWGSAALLPYTFDWDRVRLYMDEDIIPFHPDPADEKAYDAMSAKQHPLPPEVVEWSR